MVSCSHTSGEELCTRVAVAWKTRLRLLRTLVSWLQAKPSRGSCSSRWCWLGRRNAQCDSSVTTGQQCHDWLTGGSVATAVGRLNLFGVVQRKAFATWSKRRRLHRSAGSFASSSRSEQDGKGRFLVRTRGKPAALCDAALCCERARSLRGELPVSIMVLPQVVEIETPFTFMAVNWTPWKPPGFKRILLTWPECNDPSKPPALNGAWLEKTLWLKCSRSIKILCRMASPLSAEGPTDAHNSARIFIFWGEEQDYSP